MSINDGRVISNFINQAISGSDLTVNGDGFQTRSFQYIDDLINAMFIMMDTHDSFVGPVNIGNPKEISINRLASLIIGLTNSKSKITYYDLPQDDPVRRKPNITLVKNKLKWSPVSELNDWLKRTIDYFKKN